MRTLLLIAALVVLAAPSGARGRTARAAPAGYGSETRTEPDKTAVKHEKAAPRRHSHAKAHHAQAARRTVTKGESAAPREEAIPEAYKDDKAYELREDYRERMKIRQQEDRELQRNEDLRKGDTCGNPRYSPESCRPPE